MEWNFRNENTILFHRSVFIGWVWTYGLFLPHKNLHGNDRGDCLSVDWKFVHDVTLSPLPCPGRRRWLAWRPCSLRWTSWRSGWRSWRRRRKGRRTLQPSWTPTSTPSKSTTTRSWRIWGRERGSYNWVREERCWITAKSLIPAVHLVQSIRVELFHYTVWPLFLFRCPQFQ